VSYVLLSPILDPAVAAVVTGVSILAVMDSYLALSHDRAGRAPRWPTAPAAANHT
jgi:hypothetical protein